MLGVLWFRDRQVVIVFCGVLLRFHRVAGLCKGRFLFSYCFIPPPQDFLSESVRTLGSMACDGLRRDLKLQRSPPLHSTVLIPKPSTLHVQESSVPDPRSVQWHPRPSLESETRVRESNFLPAPEVISKGQRQAACK